MEWRTEREARREAGEDKSDGERSRNSVLATIWSSVASGALDLDALGLDGKA